MADHSDSDSPKSSSSSTSSSGRRGRSPPPPPPQSDESGSSDGVLVELPSQDSRSLGADPDGGILVNIDGSMQDGGGGGADDAASGETFEDAPDDLSSGARGGNPRLSESMAVIEFGEAATAEFRKYKEEREVFGREAAGLRRLLQGLVGQAPPSQGDEERVLAAQMPLHSLLDDCSRLTLELNSVSHAKDQEIESLRMKNLEASVSQDVIDSYLGSWSEGSELAVGRMIASIDSVVGEDQVAVEDADCSGVSVLEGKNLLLVEKYRQFMFEVEQLGQVLSAPGFPATGTCNHAAVLSIARDELADSKRKEADLLQKVNRFEEENRSLAEEVEKMRAALDAANAEANKTKAELEQMEHRLVTTKEKLSMAVTKGKSLVQHRDSLKQALAEKSGELETCTAELQQKSDALQATEARVEELKTLLDEKLNEHEKCLDELRETYTAWEAAKACIEELKEANNSLSPLQDSLSQKDGILQLVKEIMSEATFPQELPSLEMTDRLRWLVEQNKLADMIFMEHRKVKDILDSNDLPQTILDGELESQITWLVNSLSEAKNDVTRMQNEASDKLTSMHEEIDRLTVALLEEKQEKDILVNEHFELLSQYNATVGKLSSVSSDKTELVRALTEVSEVTLGSDEPVESSTIVQKCLHNIQQRIKSSTFEGESFEKLQSFLYIGDLELALCRILFEEDMVDRSDRLRLSGELKIMMQEVSVLKNDKDSLQKELERAEEKSSLIREKLSMAVKKGKGLVQEREGLKQALDEKNSEIQKLKHEIDSRDTAIMDFKEQIEHLSLQVTHVEKLQSEFVALNDQKEKIESMLDETKSFLQSLVDSVSSIALPTDHFFEGPREKISWIAQYIQESEVAKSHVENELYKVNEQVTLGASRLSDAFSTIKTLEDELSKSKEYISSIAREKRETQQHNAAIEEELERTNEELAISLNKLEDANMTIKSLEDALLQARMIVSRLDVEKNEAEAKHEKEISALNAKLTEYMEELDRTRGNLQSHSAEQNSHHAKLNALIMDDSLLFLMAEEFGKKINSLRDMSLLLKNMHEQFAAKGLRINPSLEDPNFAKLLSSSDYESFITDRMVHSKAGKSNIDDASSFTTIVEQLNNQAEFLGSFFKDLSGHMNDVITVMVHALQSASNKFTHTLEQHETLRLEVENMQAQNKAQEAKLLSFQNELMALSTKCADATQQIEIVFDDLVGLDSALAQAATNSTVESEFKGSIAVLKDEDVGDYPKVADSLLSTVSTLRMLSEKLSTSKHVLATSLGDLRHRLKQAEVIAETASQDHQLYVERLSMLEKDLKMSQDACNEMEIEIENFRAREDMLKAREEDLSSLGHTLTTADTGITDIFSKDQLEVLVEKVSKLNIPLSESQLQQEVVVFSSPIDKLFYIIDKLDVLQHEVETLTYGNEDMQLTLESQAREIEQLKEAFKISDSNHEELESKRSELLEITVGLERMIQRLGHLGRKDSLEDQKSMSTQALLSKLERLIIASSTEADNCKSVIQELGAKLQAKEKEVDELSTKVKMLEDSFHTRLVQPAADKERAFEASSSAVGAEISEIDDLATGGKPLKSSLPIAAHARTMRTKGSTDHLALNIGTESERLIAAEDSDDKGHVFKSLHTSGMIPTQGKQIADRVDSIWQIVSENKINITILAYITTHLCKFGMTMEQGGGGEGLWKPDADEAATRKARTYGILALLAPMAAGQHLVTVLAGNCLL